MKTPTDPNRFLAGTVTSRWHSYAPATTGNPFIQYSSGGFFAITLLLFGNQSLRAQSALDILQRFNVIVGDYNMNGETEGSVFVNGSFNPGGTHQIGFNSGALPSDTDYALWLNNGRAGSASGQTQIQSGSVLSRVSVDPGDFILNGNSPGDPSVTTGNGPWESALASELGITPADDPVQMMKDASAYFAGLASNSTLTFGSNFITFNATPVSLDGTMVAIFNIDASEITSAIGQYELVLNGADVVLVNVTGTVVDTGSGKNFIGDFIGNENRTLFNFQQATTIALNSNMRGTVFAPNATVTQEGSNLDGSVVAQVFNQNAEVHSYTFDGNLPVPEPSAVLITALGTILLLGRRHPPASPSRSENTEI